jgi:hypothetical protein
MTKPGGAEFAPPAQRIAVFDNDGALCCEQPLQIQFYFAFARVKELAAKEGTARPVLFWSGGKKARRRGCELCRLRA